MLQPASTWATRRDGWAVHEAARETYLLFIFKSVRILFKKKRTKPTEQTEKKPKKKTKHICKWQLVRGCCRTSATSTGTASSASSMLPLVNALNVLEDDFRMILAIFFSQSLWKFPLHDLTEILLKNDYAKGIWKMSNHHCVGLLDLSSLPDTYSLCMWRFSSTLHILVLNSAFKQKFDQQPRR